MTCTLRASCRCQYQYHRRSIGITGSVKYGILHLVGVVDVDVGGSIPAGYYFNKKSDVYFLYSRSWQCNASLHSNVSLLYCSQFVVKPCVCRVNMDMEFGKKMFESTWTDIDHVEINDMILAIPKPYLWPSVTAVLGPHKPLVKHVRCVKPHWHLMSYHVITNSKKFRTREGEG